MYAPSPERSTQAPKKEPTRQHSEGSTASLNAGPATTQVLLRRLDFLLRLAIAALPSLLVLAVEPLTLFGLSAEAGLRFTSVLILSFFLGIGDEVLNSAADHCPGNRTARSACSRGIRPQSNRTSYRTDSGRNQSASNRARASPDGTTRRDANTCSNHSADRGPLFCQSKGINENERAVSDIRIEIQISTLEPDRILAEEAGQSGVVVPRPRVAPTASLAEKSTPPLMRARPASASSSGAMGRARSRRRRGWRDHHDDDTRRRGRGESALTLWGRASPATE